VLNVSVTSISVMIPKPVSLNLPAPIAHEVAPRATHETVGVGLLEELARTRLQVVPIAKCWWA